MTPEALMGLLQTHNLCWRWVPAGQPQAACTCGWVDEMWVWSDLPSIGADRHRVHLADTIKAHVAGAIRAAQAEALTGAVEAIDQARDPEVWNDYNTGLFNAAAIVEGRIAALGGAA